MAMIGKLGEDDHEFETLKININCDTGTDQRNRTRNMSTSELNC